MSDVLVMGSVHRAWVERGGPVLYRGFRVPSRVRSVLPSHQVRLALEWSAFRAAPQPHVIAVSDNVKSDLQRLYKLPGERITIVPNGFDPQQCNPQRRLTLRQDMRRDLGLDEGDFALLLIANEYHRKGLAVLLGAMAELGNPHQHLLLVGRMAPTSYAAEITRLGLSGRVKYCGPTDDVARFHAAADVFVLPTQYEAFGSVIVEALASGLPVVTTAIAGAAAAIQPGVNGLLQQDPYDALELASLLSRAMEATNATDWSAAAPATVNGYEWPSVMSKFRDVLGEVARARCISGTKSAAS